MRALAYFIHTLDNSPDSDAPRSISLPAVSPFQQLKVSGNIHVQLVASESPNLVVEGEAAGEPGLSLGKLAAYA